MPSDQENIAELQRLVKRQGELIDALYRRLGIGQLEASAMSSEGSYPDVLDAIRAGSTIQAIKLYREHTNVGLKEAKDAVELLARSV
jgi:ribosomal protein L7/L12